MPGRPAYSIYQWLWSAIDLLFPATCGGCNFRGTHWCDNCQRKTNIITPPVCDVCGTHRYSQGICLECRNNPPLSKAIRSWAIFGGPLRDAIHKLKYKRDAGLGNVLARPIIQTFTKLDWKIDVIIPVPLGVARMKERGYNQSALLARPLAMKTGIRYCPQALTRVRETRSQVGLSITQRRENVKSAFLVQPNAVEGRVILVVDDVLTSGATLESCTGALLQAGALRVFGITLARAGKEYQSIS